MQEDSLGKDEKNLAMLSHLLPFAGFIFPGAHILIPLAIWLVQRDKSPYIAHHARESLNFQITLSLIVGIYVVLKFMVIGLFLMPLVIVMAPICAVTIFSLMIRATIKSSRGLNYSYPFSLRLIN